MVPVTEHTKLQNYMAYPRFLLEMELPEVAKLVYILLLDRAMLSAQNPAWRDEQGRVYLYFTVKHLAEAIHRGETTVKHAMTELENEGLIQRQYLGRGKPNRIYVMGAENCLQWGQKSACSGGRKLPPNKPIERTYLVKEGESL